MKLQLYFPCKMLMVTQTFGQNLSPLYAKLGLKGHNGWDILAYDNNRTPVRAAHNGTVVFTGEDGSGGLGVVIRTNEKYEYNGGEYFFKTIYWHLSKGTFKVKPGDYVTIGQLLAYADNTGVSTGTHLHFGLKPVYAGEDEGTWYNLEQNNGYGGAIDPAPYWTGEEAESIRNKFALAIEKLAKLLRG